MTLLATVKRRPLYVADSKKVALYIGNWALGSPCLSLFVDSFVKCLELVESSETYVPTPWYDLTGMTNILVVRMRLGHERTVDLYVR